MIRFMAQRRRVIYEDDVDGGGAAETVAFALDGRMYEVDLNEKNAAKLRKAMAPWIDAGRRVGRVPRQGGVSRSGAATGSGNAAEIRAWAVEAGYEVSARGRIPADVMTGYQAAQ
jgi:Lsr2